MTNLIVQRAFTTLENPATAHEQLTHYLQGCGYKPVANAQTPEYHRGSALGSRIGFSPKHWKTDLQIDISRCADGKSEVLAIATIDTTGQMVIERERKVFEQEMDGLVQAVSGQAQELPPLAREMERREVAREVSSRASWFYAIAAVSALNSLLTLAGQAWTFLVGLGITLLVDAVAGAVRRNDGATAATIATLVALLVNLGTASVFALCGYLAARGSRKAFVTGMILYGLDGILLVALGEATMATFHAVVLFMLFLGFRASARLQPKA